MEKEFIKINPATLSTGSVFDRNMFKSVEEILDRLEDYITWCEQNPLPEDKLYGSEGCTTTVNKMRAPTMEGFGRYLRCPTAYITAYRNRGENFADAITFVEETLYAVALEGAAAGLIKESIIARKLRITEKIEVTNTERRIVIMHTPDNGRAIAAPDGEYEEI